MDVGTSFNAGAQIYDRSRRQGIPCFDDFYRVAVELAAFPGKAPLRVLDLGAGTGLMTAFFADAFPAAHFTLVDIADEMLDKARSRFEHDRSRFTFECEDYASKDLGSSCFDLIISGLSIHHLEHDEKRALFARIHEALVPDGIFVNADEVLGPTPLLAERDAAAWLRDVKRLGMSSEDLAACQQRMSHDIMATIADQLTWLEAAGFRDVDCAYKYYMFAVYAGRR